MLKSQIYKRRTQNHFYKIYSKDVLLDSFEKIEIRLNLIKKVIQYYFDYEWTESNLILKSQLLKGKHQPLDEFQLNLLAIYLDGIHSKDIFHGDIHLRNIFINDNKPLLVDWEPCTLQKLNKKRIIKSHSRGIAIKDRKIKRITPLTDKKGFLKLISKKAFNQLADTSKMEKLTCLELLDKCYHPSPSS
ncbi:aminoglycoside phosphotransferase family protein [Flavobacteriaceae bacterium]|nr:aminoglycoside phosphotransferase family protein [Flavobacteriaceae bacterium]